MERVQPSIYHSIMTPQNNPRTRDPAEESISHESANFAEMPTTRKALKQLNILVGFLLIVGVGILAVWLVSIFNAEESIEPQPNVEELSE